MFREVIQSVQSTLDTSGAAIAMRGELESEIVPVVASALSRRDSNCVSTLEDDDPVIRLIQRSRKAVLLEEVEMESAPG